MRKTLLLGLLAVATGSACGTSIIESTPDYPALMKIDPQIEMIVNEGEYGEVNANVIVTGKEVMEPGDVLNFTIRDQNILRVEHSSGGGNLYKDYDGFSKIYLSRYLRLRGNHPGSTYVIFRWANQIDSTKVTVNPMKG